jgi:hypothetical protein
MLTLIAMGLISFGGFNIYLAFKPGYQKLGPVVLGIALIALGFYILPVDTNDRPDTYYRK